MAGGEARAPARIGDAPADRPRRLVELDARGRRLRAALGFLQLGPRAAELRLLHRWLDNWAGLGLVVAGLGRQGWDLQLTAYGDGHWRATFYVTGMAHSIVGGSAWRRRRGAGAAGGDVGEKGTGTP